MAEPIQIQLRWEYAPRGHRKGGVSGQENMGANMLEEAENVSCEERGAVLKKILSTRPTETDVSRTSATGRFLPRIR